MFLPSYQFENKTSALVFAMIICGKTKLVKYYEGEESKLDRHRRIA